MRKNILFIILIIILIVYYNNKIEQCEYDNLRYCSKMDLLEYVIIKGKVNDMNKTNINNSLSVLIFNAIENLRFLNRNNQDIKYICEFIKIKELKALIYKKLTERNETQLIIKINNMCSKGRDGTNNTNVK